VRRQDSPGVQFFAAFSSCATWSVEQAWSRLGAWSVPTLAEEVVDPKPGMARWIIGFSYMGEERV